MAFAGPAGPLTIALLTTDNRETFKDYGVAQPHFGPAPEALLQGFALLPDAQVHVVSCIRAKVVAPTNLAPNIYYHAVHVSKLGWLTTGYQGCIRAVRSCLKQIRPDIVHGQGTEKDCAITAVFGGFSNVLTIHGNMVDIAQVLKARPGSYHWFTAYLETFCLKRSAGVFCNSHYTEKRVGRRARRTWRVPNALRLPFIELGRSEVRSSHRTLLHIGAICEYKQQLEMLEVARSIYRQGLDFELNFVGEANPANPYAQAFLERVKQAQADGFARYWPRKPVDELIQILDQASALVHTPTAEAFGLVVAEALSRCLKFFGFRVGGVPDIVEGVDDAVLVEAGDWEALGAAIAGWLRAGAAQPRPTAALMRERYHPRVIAQRHLEIYREVLTESEKRLVSPVDVW